MTKQEMFDAHVARLEALGYGPDHPQGQTLRDLVRVMLDGWWNFSDNPELTERAHPRSSA